MGQSKRFGKSNVRNSLVILLDFNMLEYSKENNNYILIKDKSEMPKKRQYNQRKYQPIDNSVTMIEKRALNWYPNANYGKILELLEELGYKHIPSPKRRLKMLYGYICIIGVNKQHINKRKKKNKNEISKN